MESESELSSTIEHIVKLYELWKLKGSGIYTTWIAKNYNLDTTEIKL